MSQTSFFTTWASAENNRWKRSQSQLGSSLTTLIRRRAHSWTHLAGVYLVDDDSERPHVHRARKVRLGVADEHLGGLVRVRSAVGVEGALIKGFVRVLVRVWYQGYPKIGDHEMALRRDEDVSGFQVAVNDVSIVEIEHTQGLCKERWVGTHGVSGRMDVRALRPTDGQLSLGDRYM